MASGSTIGAIFWRDCRSAREVEQSLNLADDLAAGSIGGEALPEKTPEGAHLRVDAIAALGRGLVQKPGGQDVGKVILQFG